MLTDLLDVQYGIFGVHKLQKPVNKLRDMLFTDAWTLVLSCCKSRPIITGFGKVEATGEKLSRKQGMWPLPAKDGPSQKTVGGCKRCMHLQGLRRALLCHIVRYAGLNMSLWALNTGYSLGDWVVRRLSLACPGADRAANVVNLQQHFVELV